MVLPGYHLAMPTLDGARVLVTGGTSGVGRACVEHLASVGARVVFSGRDVDRGAEVQAGTGAAFIAAEARDEGAIRGAVDAAIEALGGLDALVCAAGVALDAPLTETSLEDWQAVIDVNLTAPYLWSVACLPSRTRCRRLRSTPWLRCWRSRPARTRSP
jgi:dihydroanticapsin dehydrogenase